LRYACTSRSVPTPLRGVSQMHLLRFLTLVWLAILAGSQSARGQAAPAARPSNGGRAALVRRLDSLARSAVADGPLASVSIAVLRGRDTLLLRAYGMADLERPTPAVATSQYRLGSVTKSYTAAAILQQVERGRLSLDDTLGKFFPEYSEWKGIKVRQLLNHTSGIPDYTSVGDAFNGSAAEDIPHDSIIGFVRGRPTQFVPGTKWSYSNTNYALLGMILERVSATPYADYLAREVYPRAGLTQTQYCDDATLVPRRALGYGRSHGKFINSSSISMTVPFAAGALCSTAEDLARWPRALRSGHVISLGSYRAMTTGEFAGRHPNPRDSTSQYGFGVGMGPLGTHRTVEHGGNINGFNASFIDVPDVDLTVAVLTNTEGIGADALAKRLAEAALSLPVDSATHTPPPAPTVSAGAPLPRSATSEFIGRYRLHVMNAPARARLYTVTERVYEEGGRLLVWSPGSAPEELVPLGNGRFSDRESPDKTFDFGVDSAASLALGAGSGKNRSAAENQRAEAGAARDANTEMGWLTVRSNQPGFVLSGERVAGP
jgi:D-alanyl-D-alanine carboxypeptidase